MACGLPLIVSDFPPYTEFAKPSFAFMVNRENIKQIHDIFNRILISPTLLETMSRESLKASESFAWKRVVEDYMKLIDA